MITRKLQLTLAPATSPIRFVDRRRGPLPSPLFPPYFRFRPFSSPYRSTALNSRRAIRACRLHAILRAPCGPQSERRAVYMLLKKKKKKKKRKREGEKFENTVAFGSQIREIVFYEIYIYI
jgi:putative component of membrane protein insertase Oxa1/YidC/SpoIIIJ protein YidD